MNNPFESNSFKEHPFPEASIELNCFQNGMRALITALDQKSRQPTLESPKLWVVNFPLDGDHTYLVWKNKVFNKGVTANEKSGYWYGPDLDLEKLKNEGQDKTAELLQELILAMSEIQAGIHNFSTLLHYTNLDEEKILQLASTELQRLR